MRMHNTSKNNNQLKPEILYPANPPSKKTKKNIMFNIFNMGSKHKCEITIHIITFNMGSNGLIYSRNKNIMVEDCLFGYQTHFGNLLERYVSLCTGVPIHDTLVHAGGLARKKKWERWKGQWRNRGGRRKEKEEKVEEEQERSRGKEKRQRTCKAATARQQHCQSGSNSGEEVSKEQWRSSDSEAIASYTRNASPNLFFPF